MFSDQMFSEWLDAVFLDWYALVVVMFAGALSRHVIGPLSGAGPAAAAVIIQSLVDSRIFNTATLPKLAVIIPARAVLGAAACGLPRSRCERLRTGQSG